MAQNYFYPNYQPPFGFWGTIRAIFGRGGGKFRQQQNYIPTQQKLILIDTSPGALMQVAMNVPHLNTVLSTGAELFSQMEIKHVNKDGEEIENSPILKFLKQPNPLQSLEQYLYEFYILNGVYNKTFQHKIQGLSFVKIPKALWLLPSGWMKINATGKIYRQTDINEIIESYEMYNDDTPYEVDKVIYMPEGIGQSVLNPVSRIEALQIPLSNIIACLKSYNIIITEKGMIGFVSPDGNLMESGGAIPPDPEELKKWRAEYQNQYNNDAQGGHVSMTTTPMKWVPMSFPVKDMMFFEGLEDSFASLCAAYRHDRYIYPSVNGATYVNKAAGLKATIQNGMQPLADKLMNQWSKAFVEEKTGERLVAGYEYLPWMQEDQKDESEGQYYRARTADLLLHNGVIDHDGAAEICQVEMTGDKVLQPKTPQNGNEPAKTQS